MLKKLGLSLFALVSTIVIANAISGNQLGFPVIGGVSYCSSFTNATCSNTVAAGPALTGNETIIANTNISGGASPQTGILSLNSIGAGKLQVTTPVSNDTITVDAQTRQLIVTPAGTIALLGVTLPNAGDSLYNGQRFGLCGTQIVTTLTLTAGTGNTFSPAAQTAMLVPVVTGAASCTEYVYSKTSSTAGVWYRVQ